MIPTMYRKRPVPVLVMGPLDRENGVAIAAWCDGKWLSVDGVILIKTLEGTMAARLGDYVICGVQGEFYSCKPDIFAETYEIV